MVNTVSAPPTFVNRSFFDTERMAGSVPVWGESKSNISQSAQKTSMVNDKTDTTPASDSAPPPTLSFGEFLDVVNPLHHVPIVGGIYRDLTGDDISSVARIIGGGLYGGPIGAAASMVNAALEEHSGKDVIGNIVAAPNSKASHSTSLNAHYSRADIRWEDKASTLTSRQSQWHFNT